MIRLEWLARFSLLMIGLGLPVAALGYQHLLRPTLEDGRVIEIRAYAPELGGFDIESVNATVGETLTLRFTSMDVTHGIAFGPGMGIDLGPVDPGEFKEVTLTFDEPGTYTYYCTTWCSIDHWRMRGVIEVRDPESNTLPMPQPDPVIQNLVAEGIDIDADIDMEAAHNAALEAGADGMRMESHATEPDSAGHKLEARPSVENGVRLAAELNIPAEMRTLDWQRTHTPEAAVTILHHLNSDRTAADLADAVAFLWWANTREDNSVRALYLLNCAACHGESGMAEGPGAPFTAVAPNAFADTGYMFERRSDVLYAKIRRGGMGTDMPNFGTLFTPEETWALTDYLWRLALE